MCSNEKVRQEVANHPNYKVRWMAGFAWKGAGSRELKRDGERKILRPGAQDMKIDHDKKEIFINGFSENDML